MNKIPSLFFLLIIPWFLAAQPKGKIQNILLIMSDDLKASALPAYGDKICNLTQCCCPVSRSRLMHFKVGIDMGKILEFLTTKGQGSDGLALVYGLAGVSDDASLDQCYGLIRN